MIDRKKVHWLAEKLSQEDSTITEESVDLILHNQNVMLFLCVWAIFEPTFSKEKYFHDKDIKKMSERYKYLSDLSEVDCLSRYFHMRYHDQSDKLIKLAYVKDYKCVSENIRRIVEQEYSYLNKNDKIYLLFYVVFRYRNNLFHGNKDITQWEHFETQINYCIQFMIKMIDEKESEK